MINSLALAYLGTRTAAQPQHTILDEAVTPKPPAAPGNRAARADADTPASAPAPSPAPRPRRSKHRALAEVVSHRRRGGIGRHTSLRG